MMFNLRRLWMHSPGMERFNVDAAAASLTGLTELCVRDCNPHLWGPKFPHATLGCFLPGWDLDLCDLDLWGIYPLNTPAFHSRLRWWSPAKGDWERE